ncbi:hypothetical protein ACXM5X_31705 [Pseudomonas saponiphila]
MKYISRNWTYLKIKKEGYNILLKKFGAGTKLMLLDKNNKKIPLLGKYNDNEKRKTPLFLCRVVNSQSIDNSTVEYAGAGTKIDIALKELIEEVEQVKKDNIEYLLKQCLEEINKYTDESDRINQLQML